MTAINTNFNFTVKVNDIHYGGEFFYQNVEIELASLRFKSTHCAIEQVSYFRNIAGRWTCWDVQLNRPKTETDQTLYTLFTEVYGLSLLQADLYS
ncbi:MAG: hypothetical protein JST52_07040 [Bacteroidetes bacterium]|nr:hypothetical protein [Bacteroidota bacterium]MBS1738986.1 hypothetical protein [Bacteroidota bacterium]MBS1775485.1 hypothetical protein [Bacteroidota bacterium]